MKTVAKTAQISLQGWVVPSLSLFYMYFVLDSSSNSQHSATQHFLPPAQTRLEHLILVFLPNPSRLQQHTLTYFHAPAPSPPPPGWVLWNRTHSTIRVHPHKARKHHRNLQVSPQKAWLPPQEPKLGLMLCKQQPLGQALQAHRHQALTEPNPGSPSFAPSLLQ